MKFVHLADCHIGGWRDPQLSVLTLQAFSRAIAFCLDKSVDFVIIAGDLFNTALPSIDSLKHVVAELHKLKDKGIPVYLIAGSHDFSPSGKTMLDILEEAHLCTNVVRGNVVENKLHLQFTVDSKTGVKITGILGKRINLEKKIYEHLDLESLEREQGFKIFVYHTAITELTSIPMGVSLTTPLSFFPKGFAYYAGGHVHAVLKKQVDPYGLFCYPGPLFPNSFKELEELKHGGFYFYEDGNVTWQSISLHPVMSLHISAQHKTPEEVSTEVMHQFSKIDLKNALVLLRVDGQLKLGKPTDVNYKQWYDFCYNQGAYSVLKNMVQLSSAEFEEISLSQKEDLEEVLIKEHVGQIKIEGFDVEKEFALAQKLLEVLDIEKQESEKSFDFEERVKSDAKKVLEIDG